MFEEESSELDKLILLLHYPELKIPNDIRLYLVKEDGSEYYVKDGRFTQEYSHDFQYLLPTRGNILMIVKIKKRSYLCQMALF